ncbi:transposase [Polaribacter filamentus]|uniref:transposase n=1 Tax=Polaribacter filamentus TaxID=53483 RepID=UPI000CF2CD31
MNNFSLNYDKILEVLAIITEKEQFLRQNRKPKLKDIELIAMNLTAEYMGIDSECQLDLFESKQIKLEVSMCKNQQNYKKQTYIFRRKRKRIETLFYQLCDQFEIRNNYAKTFEGFKTRILSKLTALTIIQYINKFGFNRNINNLKVNIV